MLTTLKKYGCYFVVLTFCSTLFGQDDFNDESDVADEVKLITITGTVSSESGRPLAGANVVVDGTDLGAATDGDGIYTIESVEVGVSVTATMIGYEDQVLYADQEQLDFSLASSVIEMNALEVLASRAGENTPVAYTNITKEELNLRLGSRDIPLALNTVPSVYATGQGGGAGDARINVRGFNQRNIAIMLNGVPVNDMENGWVYWSNWFGLDAVTSNIQVQRGLGASKLAIPSVGGTMNILTKGTGNKSGGKIKQEIGSFGKIRTSIGYNTGKLKNGWGLTLAGSYKQGNGFVDETS